MNAAYADPPYPGQSKKHYIAHADYAGEVDHPALIEHLTGEFDAWALSTSSPSLRWLLPICPESARVAAWVKPFATWKPTVRVAYSWEPVIFYSPRIARGWKVRDWFQGNPTMSQRVRGAKSREFCAWLFEVLGLEPDDHLVDLFPGSGAVSDAWEWWRKQGRLFEERHEQHA